jgi:hypothetical protein
MELMLAVPDRWVVGGWVGGRLGHPDLPWLASMRWGQVLADAGWPPGLRLCGVLCNIWCAGASWLSWCCCVRRCSSCWWRALFSRACAPTPAGQPLPQTPCLCPPSSWGRCPRAVWLFCSGCWRLLHLMKGACVCVCIVAVLCLDCRLNIEASQPASQPRSVEAAVHPSPRSPLLAAPQHSCLSDLELHYAAQAGAAGARAAARH